MLFSQKKRGKLESLRVLLSVCSRGSRGVSCGAARASGKASLHLGDTIRISSGLHPARKEGSSKSEGMAHCSNSSAKKKSHFPAKKLT